MPNDNAKIEDQHAVFSKKCRIFQASTKCLHRMHCTVLVLYVISTDNKLIKLSPRLSSLMR